MSPAGTDVFNGCGATLAPGPALTQVDPLDVPIEASPPDCFIAAATVPPATAA